MFEFNEFDNIVAGIHQTTLEEYHRMMVLNFKGSYNRKRNWDAFENVLLPFLHQYIDRLDTIWLDGSFNSRKIEPNDIDGCVFVDVFPIDDDIEFYNDFKFDFSNNRAYFKNNFCDFYPLLSLESIKRLQRSPNIHLQEYGNFLRDNHQYWCDHFGTDRNGNPKGIFEIKIGVKK